MRPRLAILAMFISVALVTPVLHAEESSSSSGSFVSPEKRFLLKPYIEVPSLQLEFRSVKNNGEFVSWAPNYRAQTGLSLSYNGWFGVSAAGKSELKAEDQALKGDSDYADFRFRFPWRRISFELGYQRLNGFYSDKSSQTLSAPDSFLKRPDLKLESKYATMIVTLRPDQYSLAAAFDQSERQVKSGGSLLATIQLSETVFSDSQALIPAPLQSFFGNESLVKRGQFRSASIGGGYGYLQTFRETGYVFGQLMLGFGAQMGTTSDDTQEYNANQSAGLVKLDLGIGGNGDWIVGGVFLSLDQTSYKTSETELSRRNAAIQIFVGSRL